jgi:hypothetical protein
MLAPNSTVSLLPQIADSKLNLTLNGHNGRNFGFTWKQSTQNTAFVTFNADEMKVQAMQIEDNSEPKDLQMKLHEPSIEFDRHKEEVPPMVLTNYFSTQGRFSKVLESPTKALSKQQIN